MKLVQLTIKTNSEAEEKAVLSGFAEFCRRQYGNYLALMVDHCAKCPAKAVCDEERKQEQDEPQ